VNLGDFNILASHFGTSVAPAASGFSRAASKSPFGISPIAAARGDEDVLSQLLN